MAENPCVSCGACCAFFRVSFYHGLAGTQEGQLPIHMTEELPPFRRTMAGTDRPEPCRDFAPSWENGVHNPHCDRARAAHGLAPLPRPRPKKGSGNEPQRSA